LPAVRTKFNPFGHRVGGVRHLRVVVCTNSPSTPESLRPAADNVVRPRHPGGRRVARNNHTLRQRLIDLAALPDQEVMKLLLPNAESWADAAKNSRNLVAHGGEGGSDVILMHAITEVTTAVIIVNVLHRLGVPANRVIEAVTTTSRLERAARLAREKWPAASV
jgi:hypothetical protein